MIERSESMSGAGKAGANLSDWLYGSFKPDQRIIELEDRLIAYYIATPDGVGAGHLHREYKLFKEWWQMRGYTREEVSRVKRNCRYDV